jgi:hypothetical protein
MSIAAVGLDKHEHSTSRLRSGISIAQHAQQVEAAEAIDEPIARAQVDGVERGEEGDNSSTHY